MAVNDDKPQHDARRRAPEAPPAARSRPRRRRRLAAPVGVPRRRRGGADGGRRLRRARGSAITSRHVSTDDAYVNGHVTYVAPRVTGVVDEVLVDDNQYVEAGALLVRLDDEPYRWSVEQRRAALARARLTVDQQTAALQQARAELDQARAQARAQLAGLQGSWYLLSTVQDLVRYQIASLRANAATLKLQQANLTLAQKLHDRQAVLTTPAGGQPGRPRPAGGGVAGGPRAGGGRGPGRSASRASCSAWRRRRPTPSRCRTTFPRPFPARCTPWPAAPRRWSSSACRSTSAS